MNGGGELGGRSWTAAIWCAMCAPWAVRISRLGWPAALLGAAVSALCCVGLARLWRGTERNEGNAVPYIIYGAGLALLGGLGAAHSRIAFPETAACPWAGLGVFALALWTAGKGPRVLGRVCCVLLPALAVLFGTVLLAGTAQTDPTWLAPDLRMEDLLPAAALGLYPAAALPLGKPARTKTLPVLALPAAAFAALTAGILSPAFAAAPGSIREVAKSLSVFGVIQRFEALLYAALLTAFFAFSALLLSAAQSSLRKKTPLFVCAAAGFLLDALPLGTEVLVFGGLYCGLAALLLPLVVGKPPHEKKFEIS